MHCTVHAVSTSRDGVTFPPSLKRATRNEKVTELPTKPDFEHFVPPIGYPGWDASKANRIEFFDKMVACIVVVKYHVILFLQIT